MHTHNADVHIQPKVIVMVFVLRKQPQEDWINYFKLQVGVFGCQTSLSHTGEIVILPHELNMTLNTDKDTHTNTGLRTNINVNM